MTATLEPTLTGITTPRLWTPARRDLTPETSRGFAAAEFAESLGIRLFPWQSWLLRHALELNEDGSYRFRIVVVLVARQNGKTTLLKVLALWRMLEDGAHMVLGTSTNLEYAREAWMQTVELVEDTQIPTRSVKRGNADTSLTLSNGARYKVASAGRRGGRSLSVDLGIADELREHRATGDQNGWEAWAALDGATTARPNSQIYGLSNAGDQGSIVLNHFREAGVHFIQSGGLDGDDTLGLFEWSADEDADLLDRAGWAQANPALGYGTITEATLLSKSRLPPAVFKTEHLCQNVPTLAAAVELAAWRSGVDQSGTLDGLRSRVALCVDVSEDMQHVTLVAAAMLDDGRVRVEAVDAWDSVEAARGPLVAWVKRIKPREVGWFPHGPAAVLDVELIGAFPADRRLMRGRRLTGDMLTAACMAFAEQVAAGRILHPGDPLLDEHVQSASKKGQGDAWRFARSGVGHVDAAFAAAGAVHLARQIKRARTPKVAASA